MYIYASDFVCVLQVGQSTAADWQRWKTARIPASGGLHPAHVPRRVPVFPGFQADPPDLQSSGSKS